MTLRDGHVAGLIEREILSRGRKALVIYGGFHFVTDPAILAEEKPGYASMAAIIERKHPGAIFGVETYTGLANKACCPDGSPPWLRCCFPTPRSSAWISMPSPFGVNPRPLRTTTCPCGARPPPAS